jgi:hypothetical protein
MPKPEDNPDVVIVNDMLGQPLVVPVAVPALGVPEQVGGAVQTNRVLGLFVVKLLVAEPQLLEPSVLIYQVIFDAVVV